MCRSNFKGSPVAGPMLHARPAVGTGCPWRTGRPSRHARNVASRHPRVPCRPAQRGGQGHPWSQSACMPMHGICVTLLCVRTAQHRSAIGKLPRSHLCSAGRVACARDFMHRSYVYISTSGTYCLACSRFVPLVARFPFLTGMDTNSARRWPSASVKLTGFFRPFRVHLRSTMNSSKCLRRR